MALPKIICTGHLQVLIHTFTFRWLSWRRRHRYSVGFLLPHVLHVFFFCWSYAAAVLFNSSWICCQRRGSLECQSSFALCPLLLFFGRHVFVVPEAGEADERIPNAYRVYICHMLRPSGKYCGMMMSLEEVILNNIRDPQATYFKSLVVRL